MFEYFTGSIAGRWRDVQGLSDNAQSFLKQIEEFVPTGNFPSFGFPKWRLGLLCNLVRLEAQEFWLIIKELLEKEIFIFVFTYPGRSYGYHADIKKLIEAVVQKEGSCIPEQISGVLVLSEDECLNDV